MQPLPARASPPQPASKAENGDAYTSLAPYYDHLTADYAYDSWLGGVEALGRAHGLRGRRVLDVGAGTGKSFLPLLARGYEISACDLSPSMIGLARAKVPDLRRRVFAADMRALPDVGSFDLVTCLDDALNHLLDDDDLTAAMCSFAARLAPGGLAVFDVNSLRTYRELFACECDLGGTATARFGWRGEAASDFRPGAHAAATIDVSAGNGDKDGRPQRLSSRHHQRHHPRARIERACASAGLRPLAVYGQLPGARLMRDGDELRHTKLVYVLAKPESS